MAEKGTVVVAMSGGVDSSVAALLLQREGYRVVGVTMQIWPRESGPAQKQRCCGLDAIEDARAVARKLGIPHYVVDFRAVFDQRVMRDFAAEYQAGRTPNPCIQCNRFIKFGALMEKARQLGADFLATGHYARVQQDPNGAHRLLRGLDPAKDQSYFLYCLTREQLARTLMPVGDLSKDRTREIAAEAGLPVAAKHSSQEICFISDNDYARFVREYTGTTPEPGPILDATGKLVGTHRGLIFYTIGQRHGLRLASSERLYVTAIDPLHNTITIGPNVALNRDSLIASALNWIGIEPPVGPILVGARIRYRHPVCASVVTPQGDDRVLVKFSEPQEAVTPGQAVVFYDGDYVLGGGTIVTGA